MSQKITQVQFDLYQEDLAKNGSGLEYDLRNLHVGDDEQSRLGDHYGQMTPEEIFNDIIPSDKPYDKTFYESLAQLYYNYVQHETGEEELIAELRKICWNIELLDSDDSLWENMVLYIDDWEGFNDMQEDYDDEDDEEESDD